MSKTINLNKALKLKKRIASNIAKIKSKIQKYNSFNANNDISSKYNTIDMLAELDILIRKMVELKSLINEANLTIQPDLYAITEYKALLSFYRNIETKEGVHKSYGRDSEDTFKAQISDTSIDAFVLNVEDRIEATQDKIDKFNYNTEIVFSL